MSRPQGRFGRGFTLIEILVVMALLGLASSVVLPGMWRMLEAAEARGQWADMEASLSALPARRFFAGAPGTLDTHSFAAWVAPLPEGWVLAIPEPIRFSRSGACSGGTVALTAPSGEQRRYRLPAPTCAPTGVPAE